MQGFARIIGVVSGKGGVGKTTTVANIGVSLAHDYKKRVLAIDGNVTTSNLGIHLGFLYPPVTLHDVLEDKVPIDQAIYVHESGLHVIPASLSVKRKAYYERLKSKIAELAANYDVILIDGAAGIGNEVKATIMASDELLIITNPEIPAVTAAIKVSETAKDMNSQIRGVVVNKMRNKSYEVSTNEIESSCESEVISTIPEDSAVQESISKRVPVIQYNPRSHAAIEFRKLAASLIGEKYVVVPFWQKVAINVLKLMGIDAKASGSTSPSSERAQVKEQISGVENKIKVMQEASIISDEPQKPAQAQPNKTQTESTSIVDVGHEVGKHEDASEKIKSMEENVEMLKHIKENLEKKEIDMLELQKSLVKIKRILMTLDREYKQGFLSKESYEELKAGNESRLEELQKKMATMTRLGRGESEEVIYSAEEEEESSSSKEVSE